MDMEAKNVPIKAKVICGGQTTILTLVLKHLRGRGSITVLSRERIMNAKLEGWPEVLKKTLFCICIAFQFCILYVFFKFRFPLYFQVCILNILDTCSNSVFLDTFLNSVFYDTF